MALTNQQKEKISIEVIKTLVTRFDNFPEDASNNRNAPFHEAFLNAFSDKLNGKVSDTPFFISLSSWLHGLNTTLGQIFFENIAHHLCNGEKREYTSKRLGNLKITQTQRNHISQIIADLSNTTTTPDLTNENNLLFANYNDAVINAMDFSADVFIEDTNTITAIELKSVKPNSGEMKGEKQKILEGKAALYRLFPGKQIHFYMGFPFDPTVNPATDTVTSFNKTRFLGSIINMTKYFDPNETLVASELWNMLSGQPNTMEEILEIINAISTTSFLSKFQLLTDNTRRLSPEYRNQLNEWNLFSELELIDNNNSLVQNIGTDTTLIRIYNKIAFDKKGNYNTERYSTLKQLI
ncbi:MAG: TdeIII family type II restriction endonuclease [Bacteroidetes bacterium]|nr:TdeIII family type II restriction endonuclease [Bacteroidota bacterium]